MRKYRSSLNLVMVRWFLVELCPFYLIWIFQFLFIISPTVFHIQLKFDISIRQRNAKVKIKFGYGSMVFGRVMSLSLWKEYEILSFCLFSPQQCYIFNSNLTYGYVKGMRRSSSNLVMVRWFLAKLCPFHFENNIKFSVSVHYLL
jgi:hypothetical protein